MLNTHTQRPKQDPRTMAYLPVIVGCLVIFAATTVFRIRDYSDKSVDFQVAFKMLCVGLSLIAPLVDLASGRLKISSPISLAWLFTLLSLVFSAVHAANPLLSLMNSVPMLGCFLLCVWMTERLGETVVVSVLVFLVAFISVCSLTIYFVYPDLGRMHAWLGSEFGENNRIQGIVGTPNGLGSMTSMALIFTLLYYKLVGAQLRPLMILAAVPSAICLLMSNSRMSMASLLICATIYFMRKGHRAANIALLIVAIVAGAAVFVTAPDMFLASLARSGEAAEITSGTGRSEIWAVVLEHIAARPFGGYGYAMSTTILPLDPRLFSVAAHCHNMYLEILFSGGVFSFSLLMLSLCATLYAGFKAGCFEPLLILLFYLLRGMTEPAPFDNLPSFAGYAFFLAISFIVVRARSVQAAERNESGSRAAVTIARCYGNLGLGRPVGAGACNPPQ